MRQPDIEIYLKHVDLPRVTEWLTKELGPLSDWQPSGQTVHCQTESSIPIHWIKKAFGNWHSLYIASAETPWSTDLDCALAAYRAFQVEVRCAPGFWHESDGEEEADRWLRVDAEGVTEIRWRTD